MTPLEHDRKAKRLKALAFCQLEHGAIEQATRTMADWHRMRVERAERDLSDYLKSSGGPMVTLS